MRESEDGNVILSKEMYWEWRCTLEELKSSKLEEKLCLFSVDNAKLKAKAAALEADLIKYREYLPARGKREEAEKEYERFKGVMETEIGRPMENVAIDPLTMEVKDLPKSGEGEE